MIPNKEIFYSRQGPQTVLKISNFNPTFLTIQDCAPSLLLVDSYLERKKVASSSSPTRSRAVETSPPKLRTLHSSQLARHSVFHEQLQQAQPTGRYREELPVVDAGQNMRELREIMRERVAAFQELARDKQHSFHFTEYKMRPAERDRWNHSTLHARKTSQSPFLKALKPKKTSSAPPPALEELKPEGKKKMVLVGGSIPVRAVSSNPEEATFSPLKSARRQLAAGHVSTVRRSRQMKQKGAAERYENDCLPWEFQKGEGMEESTNIYHYSKKY